MTTHEKPDPRNLDELLKTRTQQIGIIGPCGINWKYEIVDKWTQPGANGETCFFIQVNVYVMRHADEEYHNERDWSYPIPAIGCSMLVEKRVDGLYSSPEAPKKALANALSVPVMALGDNWPF